MIGTDILIDGGVCAAVHAHTAQNTGTGGDIRID